MFGFSNIGGYREHGSVPNSDHPKGLALDFMTLKASQANALIDYVLAHQAALGVKYVIYNRRIYQNGQWKAYTGPNPHTDHVHISFNDTSPSGGSALTGNVQQVGWTDNIPILGPLNDLADKLQDGDFWKRVGLYGLGATLIVGGAFFLVAGPVESVVT
jgi:hypothetical protein